MKLSSKHTGFGIDLWGPTLRSPEGFRYILTVLDLFSGYVRFLPIFNASAGETAWRLDSLFSHIGYPLFILSDRGTNFNSELFHSFCKIKNINYFHTGSYSPWEMGRVERRHQDLNLAFKALSDKSLWYKVIPQAAAQSINNLPSSVTGVSPAMVEYGETPRGAVDIALYAGNPIPEPSARQATAEGKRGSRLQISHHISALREAAKIYRVLAQRNADDSRQKSIHRKNKSAKTKRHIQVGSKVIVFKPVNRKNLPKKSLIHWQRGFVVTKCISKNLFEVRHLDTHVSRLTSGNNLRLDPTPMAPALTAPSVNHQQKTEIQRQPTLPPTNPSTDKTEPPVRAPSPHRRSSRKWTPSRKSLQGFALLTQAIVRPSPSLFDQVNAPLTAKPGDLLALGTHNEYDFGEHRFTLATYVGTDFHNDEIIFVEYLGLASRIKPWTFQKAWVNRDTNELILDEHRPPRRNFVRWTGVHHTEEVLSFSPSLELEDGRLSTQSLRRLGDWKPVSLSC